MDWRLQWRSAFALVCCLLAVQVEQLSGQEQPFDGVLRGHLGSVFMGVFTPDGERAITVSSDQTARCWDLKTGREVRRFHAHTGPVYAVAVSGDGRTLVTGAQDNTLRLWDVPQTRPLWSATVHGASSRALARSPDGSRWISGGADQGIRVWDSRKLSATADFANVDPKDVSASRQGHQAEVVTAAFRNDGNLFVTGDAAGRILVWHPFLEPAQGELGPHEGGVTSLAFHANNQQIVTAGNDGQIRLWQLPPQPTSLVRSFAAHEKPVLDMVLYNGGSHVVSCAADRRVVMSDMNNGQATRAFEGLAGEPRAVAVRPDNQRVAAGNDAGRVLLWNANDAQPFQTFDVTGAVTALAWSNDNQKLAVATAAAKLYFFGPPLPPQSPQPGNELVEHQQIDTAAVITRVAFDTDHRSAWATHADGRVGTWLYASPLPLRQFNHGGPVFGVAISRDGKTVVSCSGDQTVRIWDSTNGQQRAQLNGHTGQVLAIALSPDESLIVSSGADRTVRLWDVTTGKQLKQLAALDETAYSLDFHPDGKLLAAGSADKRVHLFNVLTGATERVLEGHSDYVHSVCFHSTGSRLLSYSYAGELRVWEIASGKSLMQQQIGRVGNGACYSPDDIRVLLCNGDDTARVIELPAEAR